MPKANMTFFLKGFRAMIPITTGVIPFGAVMGTVAAEAHLSLFQSTSMNILVFAGAAQLAALELMTQNTTIAVVVATGLIINLRFLLYSAAMVPVLQHSRLPVKWISAYFMTDQTYAVMSAHQSILKTSSDSVRFYLGASTAMFLAWQLSVIGGFAFGNFAPASWALDYAVPVSFVALLIPTLRNKKYIVVALFSSAVSLLLSFLPFRLGLIATALLSIGLAVFLSRRRA